jgi:hypothetical protein
MIKNLCFGEGFVDFFPPRRRNLEKNSFRQEVV